MGVHHSRYSRQGGSTLTLAGSTAGCGKPHVRWCGSPVRRNPDGRSRSLAPRFIARTGWPAPPPASRSDCLKLPSFSPSGTSCLSETKDPRHECRGYRSSAPFGSGRGYRSSAPFGSGRGYRSFAPFGSTITLPDSLVLSLALLDRVTHLV